MIALLCAPCHYTMVVAFSGGGDTIAGLDYSQGQGWGVGSPLAKKTREKNIFVDRDAYMSVIGIRF